MTTRYGTSPAVAFRVERQGDYYVPVIISANGGEYYSAPCACLDQAASEATQGFTRPLEYRGLYRRHVRELVKVEADLTCPVDPEGFTWGYHKHTHGTLDRLTNTTRKAS